MSKRNEKGQFAEGNTGRPKGSLNKNSIEVRQLISEFLTSAIPKIIEDFNESKSPRERRQLVTDFLQYLLPKLSNTDNASSLGTLSESELDYIINELKRNHAEALQQGSQG